MKLQLAIAFLFAGTAYPGGSSPPDLAISWVQPGTLTGTAGETAQIRYLIRNVGGTDAFAVISRIGTTLGPIAPARTQPGPEAGKSLERKLALALAVGMRELCIDVTLQNIAIDDSPDPNPKNNRACRPVVVQEPK
ncbi:MAG TPA: hypothetical protein VNM92_10240 [Thermoanaerobaculia bacterium]|nr:hypothetical protein [Thermoanaerobaculia bacterium]